MVTKVVGNMQILGHGGFMSCNSCGHKFTYKSVGHDGSSEPTHITDDLEVLDNYGKIIECPACKIAWTLEYRQLGNMGYRHNAKGEILVKCHCQHKFKMASRLKPDEISCPNCTCQWTTVPDKSEFDRPLLPFKFFMSFVTVDGKEYAGSIGQEHDLATFAALHAPQALEQCPDAVAFRVVEITRETAIEKYRANEKESVFWLISNLLN